MIPDTITSEFVFSALRQIDKEGYPAANRSTRFELLYDGKRYPPKYVVSLAHKYVDGFEWPVGNFSGGDETNDFLKQRGFVIVPKSRYFLQYWLPKQVETQSESGQPLTHAGSNQFVARDVAVGDIVWIVTLKHDHALHLVGRIEVIMDPDFRTGI